MKRMPDTELTWEFGDAADADRDFVFDLYRAALGSYIEETWGWDEAWQRANFDAAFPTANWKVLIVSGARVGAVRVSETEREIYVDDIEILPAYQRRGLGSAVMRSLQRVARRSGKTVGLQVLKVNPAIHFYERLGFVVVGEDDVHMMMRSS